MMTSTQLKQQVRHCIFGLASVTLLLLTSCGGGTEDEKTTTTAATTPSTNNGDNTGTQTDTTQTSSVPGKMLLSMVSDVTGKTPTGTGGALALTQTNTKVSCAAAVAGVKVEVSQEEADKLYTDSKNKLATLVSSKETDP